MIIFYLVLCLLPVIWAEEFIDPPLRVDLSSPGDVNFLTTSNVLTSWITMPIDHFDPQNKNTYQMRFMYNDEFFGGDGNPLFILVGGEWDIVEGWLRAGNMYEAARENKGYMFYTEHRYYGESKPYQNLTTENLRFLNVDQALADLAYFIQEMKTHPRFADSKVILYGGSYAANMVIWFKQRYPHLVVGGVGSSGPILAKVDFTGYLEEGQRNLERVFRLCAPLNYTNEFELGYFSGLLSWTFSTSVQQARPGTLRVICNNFATDTYGTTPMEKIAGYVIAIRNPSNCFNINYEAYVENYRVRNDNSRAWYYQTCTEYGYYQTAPRIGTVFDQLRWLTVNFYVNLCERSYDPRFNEDFVYAAADRVNRVFGGLNPNVNNTINIHGVIDPWHDLGVYDRDLSETSPTYAVPRASHCFDMQSWLVTDTIRMTNAQQAARRLIAKWLA
ncbi:unnamed protein product [Leptosia nina]|uniref:Uncharacterized protein n=1 Tax=Leptosia nina TaxID=320188 RepID=A0AAV1JA38_9NEOP